jgi:hypothetical protein
MFVNATPHPVSVLRKDGTILDLAPSGVCPRREERVVLSHVLEGVEIFKKEYGEVSDLPEEDGETIYIVSRLILDACQDRGDLLSPGTLIRDAQGRVIGCKGLSL